MSDTIRATADALADLFIGKPEARKPLDLDAIADFAKKHGVGEGLIPTLHGVLKDVSQAYWLEVSRAQRDKGAVRKELTSLLDAVAQMQCALSNLGNDAVATLQDAKSVNHIARNYSEDASHALPSLIIERRNSFDTSGTDDFDKLGLSGLADQLESVKRVVDTGLKLAFAGQKGKPPDDSALSILEASHLIWTSLIGQAYRIDWNGDDPISDAAVFSFDFARLVDPEISPKRVRTASRKVRENPFDLNGLSELEVESENICKRMK